MRHPGESRGPTVCCLNGASEEMDSGFRRNDGDDTNIPLADYLSFFSALPSAIRDALTERWGAPEADPHFVDGVFRLGLHRFGNVVVGVQPGTRLRHRSEVDLSRSGSRPAASLSRVLCVAARVISPPTR